jgi:hypothetical protein
MGFRIANAFTDSLVRLTGDEQKAAQLSAARFHHLTNVPTSDNIVMKVINHLGDEVMKVFKA